MSKKESKASPLSQKIVEGVRLSVRNMIAYKTINGGDVVIYRDGKVITRPASEITFDENH